MKLASGQFKLSLFLALGVLCSIWTLNADQPHSLTVDEHLSDVAPLLSLENRVLPRCLTVGPNRYPKLPAYYAAENREIAEHFANAQRAYENERSRPYRSMTMVAGAAGIGKTFIKGQVFKKSYADGDVSKFDIKEIYQQWQADGLAEEQPDLHCGAVVLNCLLKVKPEYKDRELLSEYLMQQSAAFYVIDSLDEVHPDDYAWILKQVEAFVFGGDRPFVQVVLFGRGLAFREYWQSSRDPVRPENLNLFLLNRPVFKTTGDLLVSNWNYDGYRYKLKWSSDGGDLIEMPLESYRQWTNAGFPVTEKFGTVSYLANDSINTETRDLLRDWSQQHRMIGPMIYNLAGNGILRDIVEDFSMQGLPFSERDVMEAYFAAWLDRDTKSSNRPSQSTPEYLELYLQLLQKVAVKYLVENKLDENGFFPVAVDDVIKLDWKGQPLQFPVTRILDRSGLKIIDPREPGPAKYRFEPIWFHRLLVESHNAQVTNRVSK